MEQFCSIEERDFYKNPPNKRFDVVFTSCSLHYTLNSKLSLEKKIIELQDIVNDGGYLYIDYMMAIDEENFEKYSKNKFFRKGEMRKYFSSNWEVLFLRENEKPSFEKAHVECAFDHYHKFGYILARKQRKHTFTQKEVCWNITPRCNQNCQYCLRFLGIDELSLKQNLVILNNLKKSGIYNLTWSGGEPLLYPYIDDLLRYSHQLGIKNKIISNGSLLSKERIDKIANSIDILTLSLDSISPDINEKLGRGKEHFIQINKIIRYVKNNYPQIKIRVNTVINSLNHKYIDELISYLNGLKIDAWRIFRVMPLRERAIKNYRKLCVSQQCFTNLKKYVQEQTTIPNVEFREINDMEDNYILLIANGDIMRTKNNKDIKIGNALHDNISTLNWE